MRAQWTETSAYRTVSSWLRLSTSLQTRIDVVAAQDDSMALGARRAFEELPAGQTRERWLSLPFLGCDGLPNSGQTWVRKGLLSATVYIPANAGKAVDMLVQALRTGSMPAEQTLTVPVSIPAIESLSSLAKKRTLSAGTV